MSTRQENCRQGCHLDVKDSLARGLHNYKYRSADLHAGVPIPAVMCEPPYQPSGRLAAERASVPPLLANLR
jgi:hypothetical protein